MSIPESIPQDSEEYQELSPVDFLRDLSNRIMHIPVMYGTNQYDADRLNEIAREIESPTVKPADPFDGFCYQCDQGG